MDHVSGTSCTPKYIVNLVSNMSIHIDVSKQSTFAIRPVVNQAGLLIHVAQPQRSQSQHRGEEDKRSRTRFPLQYIKSHINSFVGIKVGNFSYPTGQQGSYSKNPLTCRAFTNVSIKDCPQRAQPHWTTLFSEVIRLMMPTKCWLTAEKQTSIVAGTN